MKKSVKQAQSIVGTSTGNRSKNDFYPTPFYVTRDILSLERFQGNIHEPACGDGAMSKIIKECGYNVTSSDLVDRGYGIAGVDYLLDNTIYDNIITNPPFILAQKFIEHALTHTRYKVAMFLKLAFLEGERRKKMFRSTPLSYVYVYSKRVTLLRDGQEQANTGMIAFAWFVWDHNRMHPEPVIRWI